MKHIDEIIQRIQDTASGYDEYMIAHLELAKKLCEISKKLGDMRHLDTIVQTFCEVLKTQQGVIEDLKFKMVQMNVGTGWQTIAPAGAQSNYIPTSQGSVGKKEEAEVRLEVPEDGKFKTSLEVKEGFIAYLKRPNKTGKSLRDTTVFDYSSRVKSLWVYFKEEMDAGMLEGKLTIEEGRFVQGETYLNVYNNIGLFKEFIRVKAAEIKEREAEGRPFSAEELAASPLNSYKNLNNTSAALAKFEAFKKMVDEIVKARSGV